MERPPNDAPLLYRSRFLAACLKEDRVQLDGQWMQVEEALNQAIWENEQRSLRFRFIWLLLVLVVLDGIALKLALDAGDSVHAWIVAIPSVLFGLTVAYLSFALGRSHEGHLTVRLSERGFSRARPRVFRD